MMQYMKIIGTGLTAALLGLVSGLLSMYATSYSIPYSIIHVWPTPFVITTIGRITYLVISVTLVSFILHFALLFAYRENILVSFIFFCVMPVLVCLDVLGNAAGFLTATILGAAFASLLHWRIKNEKAPPGQPSRLRESIDSA